MHGEAPTPSPRLHRLCGLGTEPPAAHEQPQHPFTDGLLNLLDSGLIDVGRAEAQPLRGLGDHPVDQTAVQMDVYIERNDAGFILWRCKENSLRLSLAGSRNHPVPTGNAKEEP